MAGRNGRMNAVFGKHPPGCNAHSENRRLGILGEAEVFFRTFKDQFGQ